MRPYHLLAGALLLGSLILLPDDSRAAADDTLGMAILSATVESNGVPDTGSGLVSVNRNGTGDYSVYFERSLANCTCTASVGEYNTFHTYNFTPVATSYCPAPGPGQSNSARVFTYANTAPGDLPFQLIVFCPQ